MVLICNFKLLYSLKLQTKFSPWLLPVKTWKVTQYISLYYVHIYTESRSEHDSIYTDIYRMIFRSWLGFFSYIKLLFIGISFISLYE